MHLNGWDHALKVTAGGAGLVGHAGAILLRKTADQAGLTGQLSRSMVVGTWACLLAPRSPVRPSEREAGRFLQLSGSES